MNILETQNIGKIFHQPTEFEVLKHISFEVKKGEFLSMIGKSGSGKSTLLYILSTMDTDYSGSLLIENQLVTGLTLDQLAEIRNQKIGFVFQFHYLLPEFTCLQNELKAQMQEESQLNERILNNLSKINRNWIVIFSILF
jgi:lipoprotein-releasing system ATP-binding protein